MTVLFALVLGGCVLCCAVVILVLSDMCLRWCVVACDVVCCVATCIVRCCVASLVVICDLLLCCGALFCADF